MAPWRARRRSPPAGRAGRAAAQRGDERQPFGDQLVVPPRAVGVGEQHLVAVCVDARRRPVPRSAGPAPAGRSPRCRRVARRAALWRAGRHGRRRRRGGVPRPSRRCGPSRRRGGSCGARPACAPRRRGRRAGSMPVPESAMRFLARVRRAAIVASGTRKAAATDAVGTPHPRRMVRATWTSWASAGWQHNTTRRSSSSSTGGASSPASAGCGGQVAGGGDGGQALAEAGQPADPVERSAPGGRQQPGLDRVRHASVGPGLQGEGEGVGRRLLGDVEVARHPQRGGEHATPVHPLGVGARLRRRVVSHPCRRSPRSGAPRCSRTAPGSARRSGGRDRRRRPRRGSSRRGPP